MKRFFLTMIAALLFFGLQTARAQVGVIPEDPNEAEVDLKFAGKDCDINAAESAILRLRGVFAVNVEAQKDHLIVGYLSNQVTPQQMVNEIGKKGGPGKTSGCLAVIVPAAVGGSGNGNAGGNGNVGGSGN